MPIKRTIDDRPIPGVVNRGGAAPPPAAPTPPPTGGGPSQPAAPAAPVDRNHPVTVGPPGNGPRNPPVVAGPASGQLFIGGGPGSVNGASSAGAIAQQTAGNNVTGATPFMQTPGMQIASQRISGQDVQNDPAISAALADFQRRVAPGIQDQANVSGLGRSSSALNAMALAQGQMLPGMYESAFNREGQRLGNMNTAAENELGRQERSSQRVADANQNMATQLMGLSGQQFNQQQTAGQNIMGAGGQLRDISQQGNTAALNDFLRQQALGEQAVYAPFGGLAQGGLGSSSTTTGK